MIEVHLVNEKMRLYVEIVHYHHGDLRVTLPAATAGSIVESGISKLNLRALAKSVGVSNAAPTHHFGDKTGLFTALADEGFASLADAVTDSVPGSNTLDNMGVAYVEFALTHPAHYSVMFQRDLFDEQDAELADAQARARAALNAGVANVNQEVSTYASEDAQMSAWPLVHGYATLALSGSIHEAEPLITARRITPYLDLWGKPLR